MDSPSRIIWLGISAITVSIIASAAGDRVHSFRVIKHISRFSAGIKSLDTSSPVSLGMASDGSILTPKLDLSMAIRVVIFGKSNLDGPNDCLERMVLVMPVSKNVSLSS